MITIINLGEPPQTFCLLCTLWSQTCRLFKGCHFPQCWQRNYRGDKGTKNVMELTSLSKNMLVGKVGTTEVYRKLELKLFWSLHIEIGIFFTWIIHYIVSWTFYLFKVTIVQHFPCGLFIKENNKFGFRLRKTDLNKCQGNKFNLLNLGIFPKWAFWFYCLW